MAYEIEVTDTFGGEANYCWVNRKTLEPADFGAREGKQLRRYLVRQAKAFAGWTGMRCKVEDYGDTIDIRPRGIHQVCFVTWRD